MKKLLAILVLVLFGTISFAQNWSAGPGDIYNINTGKVGIGAGVAFVPAYNLDVAKNATSPTIAVRNLGGAGGAQYIMYDLGSAADWRFKSTATGAFKVRDQTSGLDVLQFEKGAAANCIYVKAGGFVGIGTAAPTAKLSVVGDLHIVGDIKAKSIEVTLAVVPDFVFKSDYNLRPLSEVENFINVNKHLPEVPGEKEILANGLDLGQMNATLLQKVEELTLYMIQLQKDNDALKTRISNLEK